MNNESQSNNSELKTTSANAQRLLPQSANAPAKLSAPETRDFKEISTLRRRLLISVLPVVLIPLAVASAIGYTLTERRAKAQALDELDLHAIEASTIVTDFINNSFNSIDLIAVNPDVIEGMKLGQEKVLEQNLNRQSIPDLEKQFAATKSLVISDRLDDYLQRIVESGQVEEILLTESNGLNVAFSNPTSDFVQYDENWWTMSREKGLGMDEPEFDESADATVIPFSRAVKDPETEEFLGVIKAAIPVQILNTSLSSQFSGERYQYSDLQIVDPDEGFVLFHSEKGQVKALEDAIDDDDDDDEREENEAFEDDDDDDDEREENEAFEDDDDDDDENINVIGGKSIIEIIEIIVRVEGNSLSFEASEESGNKFWTLEEAQELIAKKEGFSEVNLRQENILSNTITLASFRYQDNLYTVSTVPNTDFVSIEIIDYSLVANEARRILSIFALTTLVLGAASAGLIVLLAEQLSKPLKNLSLTTQQLAEGNLDVIANVEGTSETRTLADNFNQLVDRVKNLLQEQQNLAQEQRQEKEQLEAAIYTLLDEVAEATNGDLTVRANLDNMELSTVADLFNAIIDNLQDIAIEAKESTTQVEDSLKQNESAMRFLAEQAITEAKETRKTLLSVEQMSQSIQEVAENANQAEQIVDDTYSTVLIGTENMDLTVDSILKLRTTVGETTRKMKHLGESSEKISQVTSLIEEIALKTNVLAINASSEADRAGEYGQGFAIVAEQVGSLAKQCSAATKEIAKMVAAIQAETNDVNQAMISGTTQVAKTTHLVQSTKKGLATLLEKSQEINQLMGSISQNTVSQANTSQNVTSLMQKIADLSETTSKSSQEVAQSIVETAQVAAKLQSTVAQFKVAE